MRRFSYTSLSPLDGSTPKLGPVFAGMGRIATARTELVPRHRHREHELILVLRGTYRCRLNEVELGCQEGRFLIVKPGDWHEDLLQPDSEHVGVWFRLGADHGSGNLSLFRTGVLPEDQCGVLDPGQARALVDGLLVEYGGPDRFSSACADALLAACFWRAVRGLDPVVLAPAFAASGIDQDLRRRLERIFERRLGHGVSVSQLARDLGLSLRTLQERCRRLLGRSPHELHAEWRLERAATILATTELSVRAVAEQLGFASPCHFSRAFRRHHGHPPSAHRSP